MGCLKLTYHEKSTNIKGYASSRLIVSKEPQGFFSFNRKIDVGVYRYGFNGMEKDDIILIWKIHSVFDVNRFFNDYFLFVVFFFFARMRSVFNY